MDFLQIPPEKRIPLPAPDYTRLFLELEMEFLLERERQGFALTSEPEEPLGLFGILRREDLMEKAAEILAAGEPISRPLLDAMIWTRPPTRKTALWPAGGTPDSVALTDQPMDRPASPTSFLAIPPEKRIPLPSPDYDRMLKRAADLVSPGRRCQELWFKALRERKRAWRMRKRVPQWKRRLEKWMRENPPEETTHAPTSPQNPS
jgi:hypothetical protein